MSKRDRDRDSGRRKTRMAMGKRRSEEEKSCGGEEQQAIIFFEGLELGASCSFIPSCVWQSVLVVGAQPNSSSPPTSTTN